MSEINQDKNQEIIESEIIENPEITEKNKTVVIKKGGFLSFISLLLAASAVTGCAYLYMQLQKKVNQSHENTWQQPIADVEQKINQKYIQLSNQIKQIQNSNGKLQNQLKAIESIVANINTTDNNGTIEKYDDSQIQHQLQDLQNQLSAQNQSFNQIQSIVRDNNAKHNQAIVQINQELDNPDIQTNGVTLINRNYQYELAEHFIKAANEQFGIYGNFTKGQEFLTKTLQQMSILEGKEYQKLALEIKKVSDELLNNPPLDVVEVNKHIDHLADETSKLSFNQSINEEQKQQDKKQASWYDNLIVIRKVDEQSDSKLTTTEQQKIFQDIKNHFSMMKIALMSNKQTLWQDEITAIETLLNEHFLAQSINIKHRLTELKALDVNPTLPDLTIYLESIQSLNKDEFNPLEIPLESNLLIKPKTETKENK